MQTTNFSEILKQEYLERRKLHPRYSERAFARDLQLSPGFLKLFFQGKKSISINRAVKVGRRLNWSELKIQLAVDLLQKGKISAGLGITTPSNEPLNTLSLEAFSPISDWYYFAIIELCDLYKRGLTASQIKVCFDLDDTEVRFALKHLQVHRLIIEKSGRYFKSKNDYQIKSQPSDKIRKFHRQILEKAITAVDQQDFNNRQNMALTLSFDSKKMTEAKALIEKFVKDFNANFEKGSKDSVYQLAITFFQLDQGE